MWRSVWSWRFSHCVCLFLLSPRYSDGEKDLQVARGWVLQSLWRLLQAMQKKDLLQVSIKSMGGFKGVVIKRVSERGEPVELPEVYAVFQGLLGLVSKPSNGDQHVECFGKKIRHPALLDLLFRVLPQASLEVRHAALKVRQCSSRWVRLLRVEVELTRLARALRGLFVYVCRT